MKRVFLIVLDSLGIGELPDAYKWNDEGSNTLAAIRKDDEFNCPVLKETGLFNIESVGGGVDNPTGSYARMSEMSNGKDTTVGHWEIAGVVSKNPLPTYPNGFPDDVIEQFEKAIGIKVLCNKPYSGTEVIKDYGEEHIKTGKPIVYTSADSVFQIAAHVDVIPVDKLYSYCEIARKMLVGKHGVGRVIARPFEGSYPFNRTSARHDYSLEPPHTTMLDILKANNFDVIAVGKINDIFAGRGITEVIKTTGNEHGQEVALSLVEKDFNGLCFVNLVDFDMKYGHRNDVKGYARAMTSFDNFLGKFLKKTREDDLLIITADHGCDPSTPSTDHSREYTPMIAYGKKIKGGIDLKTRNSFADISATILEYFDLSEQDTSGTSFYSEIRKDSNITDEELLTSAKNAMKFSYSPYSHFKVGAALLTSDGKVYTGCNIENSSFSATVCAERVAIFKAVSDGKKDFVKIAVVGSNGTSDELCTPCGICRQVMCEFSPDIEIICEEKGNIRKFTLKELLPYAFEM